MILLRPVQTSRKKKGKAKNENLNTSSLVNVHYAAKANLRRFGFDDREQLYVGYIGKGNVGGVKKWGARIGKARRV
jgi:hypothetical protein